MLCRLTGHTHIIVGYLEGKQLRNCVQIILKWADLINTCLILLDSYRDPVKNKVEIEKKRSSGSRCDLQGPDNQLLMEEKYRCSPFLIQPACVQGVFET